jgi:hypothetical protein
VLGESELPTSLGTKSFSHFRTESARIDTVVRKNNVFSLSEAVVQIFRHFSGNDRKWQIGAAINAVLEHREEPIGETAVKKPGPGSHRILRKFHVRFQLPGELGKNDVNRDQVGIEAIDARRIDQVKRKFSKTPITPPPQVVRRKKPNISEQMRARYCRDSMPGNSPKIKIGDTSAVHVNFVFICEAIQLLDDAAFRAVLFVEEGGNDGDTRLNGHG